jgi:hypothetical protein
MPKKKKTPKKAKAPKEKPSEVIEDEDEFEDIELDEEDKLVSKQLEKISASDPSGPQKIMRHIRIKENAPALEKIAETEVSQDLETQLQDAPMPRKEEDEEEFIYTGKEKEKDDMYGESGKNQGEYESRTRIAKFDEKRTIFERDNPIEMQFKNQEEYSTRDEYNAKSSRIKMQRFDEKLSSLENFKPGVYEIE